MRYVVQVLAALALLAATTGHALTDASQVPVLYYHSSSVGPECSPDDTDVLAIERDARILREEGYTIVPLMQIVRWYLGELPGSALPDKVAAISLDDGHDRDWLSGIPSHGMRPDFPCPGLPSAREVAVQSGIHMTTFVIGSPTARHIINPDYGSDNWWLTAERHPLFTVGNHSIDHEHRRITTQVWDPEIGALLPAVGHADNAWYGQMRPERWTNYASADLAVRASAEYIEKVTDVWPELLAYPMGWTSDYMRSVYMPGYQHEHKTIAAFCTEAGAHDLMLTKTSDRWCLPRMGHKALWRTGDELRALLP